MPQVKISDSNLKSELIGLYPVITGKENDNVYDSVESCLRTGEAFSVVKKWVEETITKSNENKFQKKITDVLCDKNVLSVLPSSIREDIRKVAEKVKKSDKNGISNNEDLIAIRKRLDDFVKSTSVLRQTFERFDKLKLFDGRGNNKKNAINIGEGDDATTVVFFACIVLVAHCNNGMI